MDVMQARRRLLMQKTNDCPYITNGLVFWLDGIHKSDDAVEWVDIIGGKRFELHGCMKTSNSVQFASGDYGLFVGSVGTGQSNDTIEIAADNMSASQTLLCPVGGYLGFIRGMRLNGGIIMDGIPNPRLAVPSDSRLLSANTERYMINGSIGAFGENDMWKNNTTGNTLIGVRANNTKYNFVGNIYCIRIYDRHLTADEMLYNQRVDNERFGLGLTI